MSADGRSAPADIVRGRIRPPPVRKADRMQIGKPGAPVSHICQAYPDRVEVRGRDLCDDLMGRLSFTEYFHLLLTGDEPTEQQRYFLDLLLIAIAEHGMMPTSVAARMTLDADPGSLQGAVAAGILGCGPVVLGTAEPCAQLLADAQARTRPVWPPPWRRPSTRPETGRPVSGTRCTVRLTLAPSGSWSWPTSVARPGRTWPWHGASARPCRRPGAAR